MRPYLAIIIDSFREAFASRMLWILFILTTLLLAAIAPLSMVEQRATEFQRSEIQDWPAFLASLVQEGTADKATPGKRTWELLDEEIREKIKAALADEEQLGIQLALVSEVLEALNQILPRHDFYDEASWRDVELDDRTRELLAGLDAAPSEEDIALANRLLLRSAFPVYLPTVSTTQVFVTYLGNPVGTALPFPRDLANPVINEIVAAVMNFFIGTLGVFAAILVTASIIPNTFEAGSIDFLLSKPISRVLLLLTKFLGGCTFILLVASYFIVGIWLVIGIRFQLWNHRILMTIPLFLFLFSIYFCVSTFAGLRWKNATVSIVMSILFWAACFTVGTSKNVIETVFLEPQKLIKLVPLEDSVIGVRRSGEIVEWLPAQGRWDEILSGTMTPVRRRNGMGASLGGPVYDAEKEQLVFIRQPVPSFARFRLRPSEPELFLGSRQDATWTAAPGTELPYGTNWIFLDPEGHVLVLAARGLFRADGELARNNSTGARLLNLLPFMGDPDVFESVGPEPALSLSMPFSAAIHPDNGNILVWHQNTLLLLTRNEDEKYGRGAEMELPDSKDVTLACAGTTIACVLADGEVFLLDADTLDIRKRFYPAGKTTPYKAMASPDGRWLTVLFHSGRLLLIDIQQEQSRSVGTDISAAVFDGGQLLVTDRVERVTRYDTVSLKQESRYEPEMTTLHQVHRFFLLPFYWIFPKPGELSEVVDYLLTDRDARVWGPPRTVDLSQYHDVKDIAGPLKNGAWFIVIMLTLCCFYVTRKDF
jgi:ABC-type transport system involved in multi-copper enzyme maturation permease subunit